MATVLTRPQQPAAVDTGPAHRSAPPRRAGRRRTGGSAAWLLTVALAGDLMVGLDLGVPGLRPVAGLLALALVPALVTDRALRQHQVPAPERVVYVTGFLVLGVLGIGLALNDAGPALGVARPLGDVPLAVASAVLNVLLVAWRRKTLATLTWRSPTGWLLRPLDRARLPVVLASAGLLLAVLGAVRLDNGASGTVAYVGLLLVGLGLLDLFRRRGSSPGLDASVLYLSAAALVLGTSLRGWFVIGHDVMREYLFFQLTDQAAHWDIGALPDPYNACLSVTILPTVLANATGLSGVVVFKVLLQLVFALVPVATYLFCRRVVPRTLALVGTIFVLAFPTFWADMPYLVRQEIAFLFLGLCLLAATQPGWRHRSRLTLAVAMAVGVVLSHYSTTYILTLTVALGALALGVSRFVRAYRGLEDPDPGSRQPLVLLSLPMLGSLVLTAFLWTGPVTHTGGHFTQVLGDTVDAFVHPGQTMESSDLRYALLPAPRVSAQRRLDEYSTQALRESRAARSAGQLVPLRPGERMPRVAHAGESAPTPLGTWLRDATGVSLRPLTEVLRSGVARLLQVFLLLGMVVLLLRSTRTERFSRELRWLSVGACAALCVQVLAPGLSVEYGVLRAFQQALLVLAPVAATGCAVLLPLGRLARGAVAGVAMVVFAVLTGLVGHSLGGDSPQLHLANTGVYHDLYYRTVADTAASSWLGRHPGPLVTGDRSSIAALANDRRSYDGLDDQLFPSLLRRDSTVLVGSTTVRKRRAPVLFGGDVIEYRFPLRLLETTKSRVYDNGSARVYR